jgi:DHA2 family multidrug resistance protein
MLPTFMEVLDTSVANVAIPHIAGSLGATSDEALWVLTSYLVANAVVLPATDWLGGIFGRKRFLLACVVGFTGASALCGVAPSLAFLVLARILQGAAGGALQPISQAILLESFPLERRGAAMAVFVMGIVVAPIIGPTVGGWITDNYTWRWIFYVNLPVGVLAVIAVGAVVEDSPYAPRRVAGRLDLLGFGLLAVAIGTLQVVLDKGQEADWLAAAWIRWALAISAAAAVLFVVRELWTREPVVDLRVFVDRNFATGALMVGFVGAVLYGTTALIPLYLQTFLGYPALEAGLALSPRGIGAFLATVAVGQLVARVDGRFLLGLGLAGVGVASWLLAEVTIEIPFSAIVWPTVLNGVALSFVFVPLTTATTGTLPNERLGGATGLFNLMRNLGGSVGISLSSTLVARLAQRHQAFLVEHATPFNPAYRETLRAVERVLAARSGPWVGAQQASALIYDVIREQAGVLSYADTFRLLAGLSFACVPFTLLFRRARRAAGAVGAH